MINRVLIRKKLVQQLYAYNIRREAEGDAESVGQLVKQLDSSLEETYGLYHYLLLLVVDITEYARRKAVAGTLKQLPTEEDLHPNMRMVENSFAANLSRNIYLKEYLESHEVQKGMRFSWIDQHLDVVKSMYELIVGTEEYKEYMSKPEVGWDDEKEFWRAALRDTVPACEELSATLEDMSIYWNDDLETVLSFVLKTIRRAVSSDGAIMPMMPKWTNTDDAEFGRELLKKAVGREKDARDLVDKHSQNWDVERVSMMDLTILQLAITEVLDFPTIPTTVTMNEYIEITKLYSTDEAPRYVNGVLDGIVKSLDGEGKLMKVAVLRKS